jgi:hypothetical protein
MPEFEFTFDSTAKQRVQITVVGRGNTPAFDAIVELIDPDGVQLIRQDTGTSETVTTFLPKTGKYTVRVIEFQAQPPVPALGGDFTYTVANASGVPFISSDFNLLFFKPDGTFISAATAPENNINTNRPVELPRVTNAQAGGTGRVQIVMARSNVPPAGTPQATKVRYVTFSPGAFPQEYFSYQTPITFGHNSAAGANGVAAYAFFPPFIPEGFTSPGFTYIAFDKKNNRLPEPEIRQKPDMAAMDGANTTFFPGAQGDSAQDGDNFPNFFGTSAAAPHAAAIAALVLQARGGPGSVPPPQMRTVLQKSAFPHDLDPYFARGVALSGASRLTVIAESDVGSASNFTSTVDKNVFRVSFTGADSLTKIIFNPEGTNATGGNTTQQTRSTAPGTSSPGVVFDRSTSPPPTATPGASPTGFPFTVGDVRGVLAADISHTLSNPAPSPADPNNQFFTLAVDVAANALTDGEGFNFGIDRDEADAIGPVNPPDPRLGGTVGGNAADLLGANVLIPEGNLAPGGMTISGTTAGGTTFSGVFANTIGAGYTPLDGHGFINAQAAVAIDPSLPIPALAQNLSTRLLVQTGNEQGIAGLIVTGESPKRVIIRALGPSLAQSGVANPLADPVVELFAAGARSIRSNDNWRESQEDEIKTTGIPPTNDAEAAIVATLEPGNYTAVVGGKDGSTGVGLIEVYDLETAGTSRLGNISTRGSVQTEGNVVIGGFILGRNPGNARIIIRGIGPSLAKFGISDPLQDPTLELRDGNGALIRTNNDWQDDPNQSGEVSAAGLPPEDAREAAIAGNLPPGNYTAILAGQNGGTGVGLVEVFARE